MIAAILMWLAFGPQQSAYADDPWTFLNSLQCQNLVAKSTLSDYDLKDDP